MSYLSMLQRISRVALLALVAAGARAEVALDDSSYERCLDQSTLACGSLCRAVGCLERGDDDALETMRAALDKATSTATDEEDRAAGVFLHGLAYCGLARRSLCADNQCTGLGEARGTAWTGACAHRRAMLDAFLNVDWLKLGFKPHAPSQPGRFTERVDGLWSMYASCVAPFASTQAERDCSYSGELPIDAELFTSKIDQMLDDRVAYYFKDARSPYYAMFGKKKEISGHFTSGAQTDLNALAETKRKLDRALDSNLTTFNAALAPINEQFHRYLGQATMAGRVRDEVALVRAAAMAPEAATAANAAITGLEAARTDLSNEAESLAGEAAGIADAMRSLHSRAIKLCRLYYCQIWGVMDQPDPFAWTRTSDLCTFNPAWRDSLVCAGQISPGQTMQTFCEEAASDSNARFLPFFRKELWREPEKLNECLTAS